MEIKKYKLKEIKFYPDEEIELPGGSLLAGVQQNPVDGASYIVYYFEPAVEEGDNELKGWKTLKNKPLHCFSPDGCVGQSCEAVAEAMLGALKATGLYRSLGEVLAYPRDTFNAPTKPGWLVFIEDTEDKEEDDIIGGVRYKKKE